MPLTLTLLKKKLTSDIFLVRSLLIKPQLTSNIYLGIKTEKYQSTGIRVYTIEDSSHQQQQVGPTHKDTKVATAAATPPQEPHHRSSNREQQKKICAWINCNLQAAVWIVMGEIRNQPTNWKGTVVLFQVSPLCYRKDRLLQLSAQDAEKIQNKVHFIYLTIL